MDGALKIMADTYSTAAVGTGHLALKGVIRFAAARDLVGRNVAELCDTPQGQDGRPSRSFTLEQSAALIKASGGTRIGAYICLCLVTGIRTEEARALQWEAVDFSDPQAPASRQRRRVAFGSSAPRHQDTQFPANPAPTDYRGGRAAAVAVARGAHDRPGLRNQGWQRAQCRQRAARIQAAVREGGIPDTWTPRELRHTFVSLMSDSGVPAEEIGRLAGHANSRTTELVYRHQLRPIMEKDAEAMDQLFGRTA